MLRQRARSVVAAVALLAPCALLPPGCAGRKAVWKEDARADTAPAAPARSPVDKLVADADAAWQQRTDPARIREALDLWEQAVAAEPENFDALVMLIRGNYFLADGYLRGQKEQYLATMDAAVTWGERALMVVSPEFENKMRAGAKFHEAVKSVGRDGVPAMYWYASALGRWAKGTSFAVLLGQKDNVKATMDLCLELEPTYFYAGPHRYFGAYYAVAPSFAGGDLEKSKVHFNKSLEMQPDYLGTKVLWAAELATKEQDEETFERLLNEVLAAPEDGIPELVPEARVEKAKAKELLAQKAELF